jgi:hypothetical protein
MSNWHYGTVTDGDTYFSYKLHETVWSAANANDRHLALIAATKIIDALNFKGDKHTLFISTYAEVGDVVYLAANASQNLEFPRDGDTTVPLQIEHACYEIARSLLDGRDPETELEALSMTSQGYAALKTQYIREGLPMEHIVNGVPSFAAWCLLRPFLRDVSSFQVNRAS